MTAGLPTNSHRPSRAIAAAAHKSARRYRYQPQHQPQPQPLTILLLAICTLLILAPRGVSAYEELSDAALRSIPGGGGGIGGGGGFDSFDVETGALLAPLLMPRVPGTAGSAAAQHHIAGFFARELPLWSLRWHNSTSKTPATGDVQVPFANMIFTRDPPWMMMKTTKMTTTTTTTKKDGVNGVVNGGSGDVARLALVAHYDSLYRPEGFVGAVDSAAPCAMLMHVARAVDEALTRKWEDLESSGMAGLGLEEERGVQILFLDGEEAWVSWSATDSLYGARALAETWEAEMHPALSTYKNPLDAIELFVLLDLLGASDPHVPSYFETTHWAYQGMAKIEARMRELGLLKSTPKQPFLADSGKRPSQFTRAYVQDDHVPFMARGVPVLHIIPTPFPAVWHRMEDDGAHLDPAAVDDWAKIVTAFVAEWMELDGIIEHTKAAAAGRRHDDRSKTEL